MLLGGPLRHNETTRAVVKTALRGEEFVVASSESEKSKLVPPSVIRDLLVGDLGKLHHRGLRLRGVVVDGDLDLSHLEWSGTLQLLDCTIRGDVFFTYSHIKGEISLAGTTVQRLDLRYASIDGNLFCNQGFVALRGIRGLAVRITGGMYLQGSTLTAPPEQEFKNSAALDIYRANIGDLYAHRITLNGGLYAIGATFTRNVRLPGATIRSRASLGWPNGNDAGHGVDLSAVTVGSSIYLWTQSAPRLSLEGRVSLAGASCANLFLSADQLTNLTINLDRCTYRRLEPATGEDLLKALGRSKTFPQYGYTQLVRYASDIGAAHLARRAAIEQQRRIAAGTSRASREGLRRRLLGLFVGYGYSPGRALLWLVLCVVSALFLLRFGGLAIQGDPPRNMESWGQAFALAMDHLLPFAGLEVKSEWALAPRSGIQWVLFLTFLALKVAAWALIALALASVTGLIRRS